MSCFYVANLGNSGLFPAICALNRTIFSPEKFNPDLIRASLNRYYSRMAVDNFRFTAQPTSRSAAAEILLMKSLNRRQEVSVLGKKLRKTLPCLEGDHGFDHS